MKEEPFEYNFLNKMVLELVLDFFKERLLC